MFKLKPWNQMRHAIGVRHLSRSTEQAHIRWIRNLILFHGKRHPFEMDQSHISQFLSYLAVGKKVASSTQNRALNAGA